MDITQIRWIKLTEDTLKLSEEFSGMFLDEEAWAVHAPNKFILFPVFNPKDYDSNNLNDSHHRLLFKKKTKNLTRYTGYHIMEQKKQYDIEELINNPVDIIYSEMPLTLVDELERLGNLHSTEYINLLNQSSFVVHGLQNHLDNKQDKGITDVVENAFWLNPSRAFEKVAWDLVGGYRSRKKIENYWLIVRDNFVVGVFQNHKQKNKPNQVTYKYHGIFMRDSKKSLGHYQDLIDNESLISSPAILSRKDCERIHIVGKPEMRAHKDLVERAKVLPEYLNNALKQL